MWMFDTVDQSSPLPPVLPGTTTVLLVDGRRMAVAGNSVGGDMAAVLAMMAKDRGGPRAFMEFGWNIYAHDGKTRKERYAAPLEASLEQIVKSRSGT